MTMQPPRLERRRRADLARELAERARAFLPDVAPRSGTQDVAAALLAIVARLQSEVTQRLDRVPEKTFRGFVHWLGLRGAPGREFPDDA